MRRTPHTTNLAKHPQYISSRPLFRTITELPLWYLHRAVHIPVQHLFEQAPLMTLASSHRSHKCPELNEFHRLYSLSIIPTMIFPMQSQGTTTPGPTKHAGQIIHQCPSARFLAGISSSRFLASPWHARITIDISINGAAPVRAEHPLPHENHCTWSPTRTSARLAESSRMDHDSRRLQGKAFRLEAISIRTMNSTDASTASARDAFLAQAMLSRGRCECGVAVESPWRMRR